MKNANYGTGRRKAAIARVWVKPGEGKILINGREHAEYLGRPVLEYTVTGPLRAMNLDDNVDIVCTAKGGGISGQAGAIRLGIARALVDMDENLRTDLKANGFLTRDARIKERKKYGRKKARRGFQFVKR